jgi:hypothetical protein
MPPPIKQVTKAPHLAVRSKHYSRSRWQNSRPANRIVGRRTMVLEAPALSSKRGTTPVQQTSRPTQKIIGAFFCSFFREKSLFYTRFQFCSPSDGKMAEVADRRGVSKETAPRTRHADDALPYSVCGHDKLAMAMHACMYARQSSNSDHKPPSYSPIREIPPTSCLISASVACMAWHCVGTVTHANALQLLPETPHWC